MINKLVDSAETPEDKKKELRPDSFEDFVGQQTIKKNTKVYVEAALARKEALDHCLLSGPPGLGKTTFSMLIAKEMHANLRSTAAPAIEKTGDMASLLSSLQEKDILFIDEIHRLKPIIEEMLYGAMEDFHLDLSLGGGTDSRSVRISLPKFTLIGATTKIGALTQPLISRFGITHRLNYYTQEDLWKIAFRNCQLLKIKIDQKGLLELAKRSRGTPRILNRLLRRIRDYSQVHKKPSIDEKFIDWALNEMEIDRYGLDEKDRRLLEVITQHFNGGPVGIENLATSLSEDRSTIEDVYEPFLIQLGFMQRTARGRVATKLAYDYLGISDIPTSLTGENDQKMF